jgi:hypothetical protein
MAGKLGRHLSWRIVAKALADTPDILKARIFLKTICLPGSKGAARTSTT